ncbi:CotH kinase family protein [uncultured Shewanella sp.]|uniref:CotH kinase family protein n=1 Tax=uncultured Shewanella sp. TaxID=173975 RepID=UPI00262D8C26|nr:CotH kinase family protein [uncultured Shewanella sp.]
MDKRIKNEQDVIGCPVKKSVLSIVLALSFGVLTGCGGNNDSDTESSADEEVISEDTSGTLVINEVVSKGLEDDWIELYVTQGEVNLSDYSLLDDNTDHEMQSLPDVLLSAGEYYVIKAIDEDDAASQEGAYVTFKLGSSDSVNLFKGLELVDQVSWESDEAFAGFSYGRYPDGEDSWVVLTPTPESANKLLERGPLMINEVMVNSVDSDGWVEFYNTDSNSILLSDYQIQNANDDVPFTLPNIQLAAGAHYTMELSEGELSEGSTADNDLPMVLGSSDSLTLSLSETAEIRDYLAWNKSDAPSGYSYGSYPDGGSSRYTLAATKGESNQQALVFDTDNIENVYIEVSESDWQDIIANAADKAYHTASITYKNVTLDNIGFRTKGNSTLSSIISTGSTRFSFKVDTDEYESNQALFNLTKLNFNNNYNDPTYMRETLSYDLMRGMGLPSPRTAFVNLYINNELHGLYTMVEQVDSAFLARNFNDASGDLYKPDDADNEGLVGHDLQWIDENFASYSAIELKTNKTTTDNSALMAFLKVINQGGDESSVLDSDAILKYLAISTAMSNLDSYQGTLSHNYYLYEQAGQFSVIPWDFNESFGTFSMGCDVVSLYIDEPTQGALSERPLIASLLSDEQHLATYHGYLNELIDGELSVESMTEKVADIAEMIRDAVDSDPTAFYTSEEFETGLTNDVGRTPGLLSFVAARVLNIEQQLTGAIASKGDGTGSCGSTNGPRPR